jgi:hypothetical protein
LPELRAARVLRLSRYDEPLGVGGLVVAMAIQGTFSFVAAL